MKDEETKWQEAFAAYVKAFGEEPDFDFRLSTEENTAGLLAAVKSGKPVEPFEYDKVIQA